jgi:hypothetical protein
MSINTIRTLRPRIAVGLALTSLLVILMVLGVIAALAWRPAVAQPTHIVGQSLMVRGYVAARVGGRDDNGIISRSLPARDVYLPAVEVFLVDAQNSPAGAPVRTDLSGRFTLYAPKLGRYKICWKAQGFVPGCDGKFVSLGSAPQFVSTLRIPIERRDGLVVFVGKVRMADGSLPRMLDPLANINAFATVTLLDANGGKQYVARVNNFGDYLVPQVPIKTDIRLRAEIEKGLFELPILKEAELERDLLHEVNLRIANNPPKIEPLVPVDANTGARIQVAAPGTRIALKAVGHDSDGDPLSYTWQLGNAAGTLSSAAGASTTWQLPPGPGQYGITVFAWDGKGGYAKSDLLIRSDNGGVPFSGLVRENSGAAVPGARIEIGAATATTDASGMFNVRVAAADRYVFNIRKEGYGFYSKIYDRGVGGGVWTLTRATTQTVDPTQPIQVVNRREPSDCPGPRFARLDWRSYPAAARPQWQDGKGNVIFPNMRKGVGALKQVGLDRIYLAQGEKQVVAPVQIKGGECGPGMAVSIPANALVDSNGQPPAGKVQVSVSTIDLLSPEQMPGDYTVAVPNSDTRVMESFGAGSIEITAGGKRYNLKPGKLASVRIPVDPAQLAAGGTLPLSIPILFYDEKAGVWRQDGTAPLVGSGAARAYVANVKHFSTINGDTLKQDQACVRVLSPQPGMPASYNLEVTIPQPNGNAPKVKVQLMSNAAPSEHVIYNLPTATNIVLVPSSITPNTTPFGVFIVNTGQKQNPTSPNLPLGPPYAACATQVTLTQQAIPDAPLNGEFLQGVNHFSAANLDELNPGNSNQNAIKTAIDQATVDYYAQVDPRSKRSTLAKFRQANGFADINNVPLPGVVNTKYANSGDLGFGRDMYCQKQTASDGFSDYACYVSNYGDVTTADQQDAIDAVAGGPPVATVAMEYSRIESALGTVNEFDDVNAPIRSVKFYVYNSAGDQLLRAANLDGKGARPVPQLCMVCHGGALVKAQVIVNGQAVPVFAGRDDVKLGSVFVPFDLRYYTFPPAPNDKANVTVQANFKQLNTSIVSAVAQAVGDTAIQNVIDEMYSGGASTQIESFTVAGWRAPAVPEPAKPAFYQGTVSNACRMCHTAQAIPGLRFESATDFIGLLSGVGTRVCTQHVMPHANRTHEIFWGIADPTVVVPGTVPHMAAQLQIFGTQFGPAADWIGSGGNPPAYQCGTSFTSGGSTPISYYEQNIQSLWGTYGCTGCHAGNNGAGGLGLGEGFSYSNIVNVPATELPSMMRIKPLDSAHSYLYHKVVGDQGGVGGSGARMPFGCSGNQCVSATDLNTIKNWIDVRGADGP